MALSITELDNSKSAYRAASRLKEGAAGRILGSYREQQVATKKEQQVGSLAHTLTQRAASRLKEGAAGWLLGSHTHTQSSK